MKKTLDIKKLILLNMPYILLGLFATNFGEAWRMAQGADASEKFLSLVAVLPGTLQSFWPSLHPLDLLVGLCCGVGLRLAVYLKSKNTKKYRHGLEYGSARWGTREDIAPYVDPVFQNNVILTKTESLTMNSRPKDPKTARNKNVLVIGGSGSGKTRFWLKPNLMQMHSSYVVTDPKGTILVECGKMLQRGAPKLGKDGKPMKDKRGKVIYEPYRIKVLNTINFKKSMHYNPFAYIHSEKDMDLDVEVSRLKLMKADHQSKQYRLEDQLLKYFPEEIEKHKGFIKGFESDLEVLAAHPHPEDGFAGMEIRGDLLTDKENAGAALLDACKEVKTSDPVQIGSYRGYAISVEFSAWKQEYTILLKGQMTHRATLGTDPRGNLTRIDNALAQMPQRLEAARAQLDNLYQQQAAAKEEVGKPFLYEEELRSKNARLVELDTLLNIDGKGHAQPETVVAKSARPSVLDSLKRPATPRSTDKKPKQHEEVR